MSEDRVDKWETRNGVTRASGVYSEVINQKTQATQQKSFDVFRIDSDAYYDPDLREHVDPPWCAVSTGLPIGHGSVYFMLRRYEGRTEAHVRLAKFREEFPE